MEYLEPGGSIVGESVDDRTVCELMNAKKTIWKVMVSLDEDICEVRDMDE